MAEVAWTEQAADDLDAACEYIARDSEYFAAVFAERVLRAVERLEALPESGRVVPEAGRADIREIVVQNYRAIYHVEAGRVLLLTIHHGARLLDLGRLTPGA
ncbi:MAG: type II toxin-antitoxin system RelE/ParE family toxin [Planctomycetales bacterium]|nr:type II toxin-antitoxin system RelE/ParE family toxin [Planctomycetales bacterium]